MELNVSTKIRIHGLGYPTANPPKIMNATKQIVDQRTVDARGIPSSEGSMCLSTREYRLLSISYVEVMGTDILELASFSLLDKHDRRLRSGVVVLEAHFLRF
jgi:hypothetical protein